MSSITLGLENNNVSIATRHFGRNLHLHIKRIHSERKKLSSNVDIASTDIQRTILQRQTWAWRSWQCQVQVWNLRYTGRYAIKTHLYVHVNFKPYQCMRCNKTFAAHTNLWHQIITSHHNATDTIIHCNICNKLYICVAVHCANTFLNMSLFQTATVDVWMKILHLSVRFYNFLVALVG